MGAALCTHQNKIVDDTAVTQTGPKFDTDLKFKERLWFAVRKNDKQMFDRFFQQNEVTEANLYDSQGQTLTNLAARLGHVQLLMALVERTGAKSDLVDVNLQSPLHVACTHDQLEVAKFLVNSGADVNLQDDSGSTPLMLCCKHGRHQIARFMIEASHAGLLSEPLDLTLADHDGMTPLSCAVCSNNFQMVKILVGEGGADVSTTNSSGLTPLMEAAIHNCFQIVEYLLSKKASLVKQDNAGATMIHHAVEQGNLDVIKTLIELGFRSSHIDVKDNAGQTPIYEALSNLEMVRLLTKEGLQANLNVFNYLGQSPLYKACMEGNLPIVEALVQNGAQVDFCSDELHESQDFQIPGLSKDYLEAYKNAQSPLQIACVMGHQEVVEYLVHQCQANVNFQTYDTRYSVLHLCALADRVELILYLLTVSKADPLLEDKNGQTVLDIAFKTMSSEQVAQIEHCLKSKEPVKGDLLPDDRQLSNLNYASSNNQNEHETAPLTFDNLKAAKDKCERVKSVFGDKISLCLASDDWKFVEAALKYVQSFVEKLLSRPQQEYGNLPFTLISLADACISAVSQTCESKVVKIQLLSLQLFNTIVQSKKVENDDLACKKVTRALKSDKVIKKLILASEKTTNQRLVTKIHDSLSQFVYQQHLQADSILTDVLFSRLSEVTDKALTQNLKLFKSLITTFGLVQTIAVQDDYYGEQHYYYDEEVPTQTTGLYTKDQILGKVLPLTAIDKKEIRSLITQILIEIQTQANSPLEMADLEPIPDETTRTQLWHIISSTPKTADRYKQIITDKGSSKDCTHKEIALNTLQEFLESPHALDEPFAVQCCQLVAHCSEQNNLQLYLLAVDALQSLLPKIQNSSVAVEHLLWILKRVALKTTDTNTRVRNKSAEVFSQVWCLQFGQKQGCQIACLSLMDTTLGEKAIIGRLGVLVKRASLVDEVGDRPISQVLGKDYESLTAFACSWCGHKTTKVRQTAMKLIVQICRINQIDSQGAPFKSEIVKYIMGLRSQIREPLVRKINSQSLYIPTLNQSDEKGVLPCVSQYDTDKSSIVLPHSEPLCEAQVQKASQLIELFGAQLVTCFYSQNWSTRLTALQKVDEQLSNLVSETRDALTAEINKDNLPPEIAFKSLLKLIEEGLRDPVLAVYVQSIDLFTKSVPMWFKRLPSKMIHRELEPIQRCITLRLADMKQKVRDASTASCLQLARRSEVGPDFVTRIIVEELSKLQWEKQGSYGNSYMIVSCVNMLVQLDVNTEYTEVYVNLIGKTLRHSNPNVRRAGEALFKVLHQADPKVLNQLKLQKPKLVQKLFSEISQPTVIKHEENVEIVSEIVSSETLSLMKMPEARSRVRAIVEIKKQILARAQDPQTAHKLPEPLTRLFEHILKDESVEVYLEGLQLLKLSVQSLAKHLSQLDLHLLIGKSIKSIMQSQNHSLKAQLAADKSLIHLCRNERIGSFVIAKETIRLAQKSANDEPLQLRYFGLLQMLMTQFSSSLCYQQQFLSQLMTLVSDTLAQLQKQESPALKSACTQLLISVNQIDAQQLEKAIQSLSVNQKTYLKKILIEQENNSKGHQVDQRLTRQRQATLAPDQSMGDTQSSFASRNSLMSPSLHSRRRSSRHSIEPTTEKPRLREEYQTTKSWLQPQQHTLAVIETKKQESRVTPLLPPSQRQTQMKQQQLYQPSLLMGTSQMGSTQSSTTSRFQSRFAAQYSQLN